MVRHAALCSLRHQHVLWPAAAAEVEGSQALRARVVTLRGEVAERLLEGDRHGRLCGHTSDGVLSGVYCRSR